MKKNNLVFSLTFGILGAIGVGLMGTGAILTFNKPSVSTPEAPKKNVESIYVATEPSRMIYLVGETFDPKGMTINALFDDGSEEEITDWAYDKHDAFDHANKAEEIKITYTASESTSEEESNVIETSLNVRVVDSVDGIGTAVGLKPISGPVIQKAGTKFDKSNMSFHVLYELGGKEVEGNKVYKFGQNIDGNSYNTIKLSSESALITANQKTVDIAYSQGKTSAIDIVVATSVSVSISKTDYVANKDEFDFKNVKISAEITNGNEFKENIANLSWFDSAEGKITQGHKFSVNGEHTITCAYSSNFPDLSFKVNVTGGIDKGETDSDLNPDTLEIECEDTVITGASALVENGSSYKDTDCGYGEFHAAAYLRYTGEYKYSGKGFVHNFDQSRNASMEWTINAPGGGKTNLIVRGATNAVTASAFVAKDLLVKKAVRIFVNNDDITDSLSNSATFKGRKDTTPDPQNRTNTAGGISCNGRYMFLLWNEVNLGTINLIPGNNTIKLVANNESTSGHWDSLKLDFTPFKSGGAITPDPDDSDSSLNPNKLAGECEDIEIKNAFIVGDNGDNCSYGAFHKVAYTGYTGEYKYSGKGFVHNFDQSRNASMKWTINAPGGGKANLNVRGASNDVDLSSLTTNPLNVTKAAKILVNGVDITSSLNQDAKFRGRTETTLDPQNKTETAGGVSCNARYLYLLWTDVNLGTINLKKGENTIEIIANNDAKSCHWDSLSLDFTPFKASK